MISDRERREKIYKLVIGGKTEEAVKSIEKLYLDNVSLLATDIIVYNSLFDKAAKRGLIKNSSVCKDALQCESRRIVNMYLHTK